MVLDPHGRPRVGRAEEERADAAAPRREDRPRGLGAGGGAQSEEEEAEPERREGREPDGGAASRSPFGIRFARHQDHAGDSERGANRLHCRRLLAPGEPARHGDQHYRIAKSVQANHTTTDIQPLSFADRIEEIARMSGGKEITDTTRKHAEEMLTRHS